VPSVVQGLVFCTNCGYALYRTSTRSSARTIYYYRCLGSDTWRRLGGPICHNRPIRQDLLDGLAWTEIVKLLEEPGLIQVELDRRLEAASYTDPTKRREDALRRDLGRLQKSIARLLTAYQEDLLSLDELRHRMPELRQREYATRAELQSIAEQTTDRAAYLRLAETLTAFSRPFALVGRNSRHNRASARGPTAGQGDPGQRRQNRDPALHSPSNWTIGQTRPFNRRLLQLSLRQKLPFAFRE
jgi:hypothetical protein